MRSRAGWSAPRRADPLPERLAALWRELEALVEELAPSAIAVERVLFQVNTRTAMSVGQASGLALGDRRPPRHPRGAVQPQRGEARGGG